MRSIGIGDNILELFPFAVVAFVPLLYVIRRAGDDYRLIVKLSAVIMTVNYSIFWLLLAPNFQWWFPLAGGLFGLGLGWLFGSICVLSSHVSQPHLWALAIAVSWTGLWFLVCKISGSFVLLSTTFGNLAVILQPVSVFSQFGLEFLLFFTAASLACGQPRVPALLWSAWMFVSLAHYHQLASSESVTMTSYSGPSEPLLPLVFQSTDDKKKLLSVFPGDLWVRAASSDEEFLKKCYQPRISDPVAGCVSETRDRRVVLGKFDMYGGRHDSLFGERSSFKTALKWRSTGEHLWAILTGVDLAFPETVQAATAIHAAHAVAVAAPSVGWAEMRNQHLVSVFRAIELRVAVVRVDGGFSASIVSARGDVLHLHQAKKPTLDIKTVEVPLWNARQESYARIFNVDWLGRLTLTAAVVWNALSLRVMRRRELL